MVQEPIEPRILKIRTIKDQAMITLPRDMLRFAGLAEGDHALVECKPGCIIVWKVRFVTPGGDTTDTDRED